MAQNKINVRLTWRYMTKCITLLLLAAMSVTIISSVYSRRFGQIMKKPLLFAGIRLGRTVGTTSSTNCLPSAIQNGYWVPWKASKEELEDLRSLNNDTWNMTGMPIPPQRKDGRCGDVKMDSSKYFRAQCDPEGSTPCCENNTCVRRTVQQCRCSTCMDVRQNIEASFATYQTSDPNCQLKTFKDGPEHLCPLLKDLSIYFIGDSLIRQMFTSFVAAFNYGNLESVWKEGASEADKHKCRGQRIYVSKCRQWVTQDITFCNGTVQLKDLIYYQLYFIKDILATFRSLLGKPNSIVFIGIGFHDKLNSELIDRKLLGPLKAIRGRHKWPHVVWAGPNCPGLYKGLLRRESFYNFVQNMKGLLGGHNIPLLDFFNLTDNVFSYDGIHFTKGVNDVKVQIILNYIHLWRNA